MTREIAATLVQNPEQGSGCTNDPSGPWSSSEDALVDEHRDKSDATCEPVDVCLLDTNNLRLSGTLRWISKSGMQIDLKMPVQIGDRLEVVQQNGVILFGEVRYCLKIGGSYQVRGRISDVYYPKGAESSIVSKPGEGRPAPEEDRSQVRAVEKRPAAHQKSASSRPAKPGFPLASLRNGGKHLGAHLTQNDIDDLLALKLSETKAALLERHLADCDKCLDLMLLTLDQRASSVSRRPRSAPGKV